MFFHKEKKNIGSKPFVLAVTKGLCVTKAFLMKYFQFSKYFSLQKHTVGLWRNRLASLSITLGTAGEDSQAAVAPFSNNSIALALHVEGHGFEPPRLTSWISPLQNE